MSIFGIAILSGLVIIAIVGSIIAALSDRVKPDSSDSSLELPGFDFSHHKADEIRRNYW